MQQDVIKQEIIKEGNKNFELAKEVLGMKEEVSLNERILVLLSQCSKWNEEVNAYTLQHDEAANAIEKLILQEKIDLLKVLQEDFMNKFLTKSARDLGYKITELTNQLNQL